MDDVEMIPLDSSNVAAAGYDPKTRILQVEFVSGGMYVVEGVPQDVFDQLRSSSSPGGYYHRNIKNVYPARRIG